MPSHLICVVSMYMCVHVCTRRYRETTVNNVRNHVSTMCIQTTTTSTTIIMHLPCVSRLSAPPPPAIFHPSRKDQLHCTALHCTPSRLPSLSQLAGTNQGRKTQRKAITATKPRGWRPPKMMEISRAYSTLPCLCQHNIFFGGAFKDGR